MKRRERVTLKTVAELAGCSLGATSVVLNKSRGNIGVSQETRTRVLEAAQRLNYQPHFAARSLARQSTRTLGIYITPLPWGGIGSRYEGQIVRGIEQAAHEHHYDLLVINMTTRQPFESCLRKIEESRIDGLILINLDEMAEQDRRQGVEKLLERTRLVVAIDNAYLESCLDSVIFDNPAAIRLAVKHLAALGHRRIGFLGGCLDTPLLHSTIREKAFAQAMAEANLDMNPAWIHHRANCASQIQVHERYCTMEGRLGAAYMMSLPASSRPTALIGYNDLVAAAALQWLGQQGIKVPAQVSVVGVDDNADICELVTPGLTSIQHPLCEMGRAGTRRLIARHHAFLSGRRKPAPFDPIVEEGLTESNIRVERHDDKCTLWFGPELTLRNSTSAPPADS